MVVLLGLLVALAFGSGDFVGGRASRDASTPAVLLVSQAFAVLGAVTIALAVEADVERRDLTLGLMAGSVNVAGLGLLYRGLASGRMGVVAPVAAVAGAVVPVGWGLVTGERPGAVVLVGIVLAMVAAALVAREPDGGSGGLGRPVAMAVAAGAGLGASFVLFAETSEGSGFWPVLTARVAATVLVCAVVVVASRRAPLRFPQGPARRLALAAGALDVTAAALLLVAVRRELTAVVAPVAALAPAFTVLWAWAVLRERVGRWQASGLALALAGLVLIAAG